MPVSTRSMSSETILNGFFSDDDMSATQGVRRRLSNRNLSGGRSAGPGKWEGLYAPDAPASSAQCRGVKPLPLSSRRACLPLRPELDLDQGVPAPHGG